VTNSNPNSQNSSPLDRLLLVKVCASVFQEEIDAVQSICAMHKVDFVQVDQSKGEKIPTCEDQGEFSIVYLAGHGNFRAFGDAEQVSWEQFAEQLCSAACLKVSSTIFAACCEGGMKSVALEVFKKCPRVGYVIGPKSLVTQQTLAQAFHSFLYNISFRKGGVDQAVRLMCESSGHTFLSHDLPTTYLEHKVSRDPKEINNAIQDSAQQIPSVD
jgi:hypothetical protein